MLLATLSACKTWEDLSGPVSGVAVSRPLGGEVTVTEDFQDTVVFAGACLDEKGLSKVRYGFRTDYRPWEGTNSEYRVDSVREAPLTGTFQSFADSVVASTNWPQGRMLFYSIVTNQDGVRSDSNIAYKYLRNRTYPLLSLSAPVTNATFTNFFSGQLVTLTGRLAHVTDDTIRLTARPCLLRQDGSLQCPDDSVLIYRGPAAEQVDFTDTIEMPLNAQVGELYRLKVSARVERTQKETFYAPGFQLRQQ